VLRLLTREDAERVMDVRPIELGSSTMDCGMAEMKVSERIVHDILSLLLFVNVSKECEKESFR